MTQQELQKIFESEFNWDNWKKVMNFVFPEFKFNLIQTDLARDTKAKEEKAGYIKVHGQSELASNESLMLCEVLVKDKIRLDRNIKSVRSLVAGEVIPNFQTVIAVFHNADNTKWRFTLVVKEFSDDHKTYDKKPDSYTYVFGVGEKGRTAAQRFLKLSKNTNKSLKDLEEAFSVEALSKDFFKEYKAEYQKFVDDIILVPSRLALFNENGIEKQKKAARDFVKKMMGRMVFLYFLQKKGWLGCKTKWQGGDEQFMKTFVDKAVQDDSFYFQYLEPLFFDTLNAKRTKQDEDCIIQKKNFGKVPYLNGGLFEKDENHPNGLTLTWANFQTFFDTLNNYNFTIIEDDPEFKEVAVDPEMLGHIFENLLEDNKDKGAFYTPKEIVHYMCQESLYEYLKTYLQQNNHWPTDENETQPLEKALQRFVKQKLAGGIIDYDKPLAKALKEVKICDPAIGSGAFPMGLLNEIYHCVHKLHDESPDKVGDVWGIGKTWQGNKVKLNIIQHSIYGVDIEKGAVDIARLRFWLSLIVDEPEPTPLPNLEYKIVVGNSLVSKLGDDIVDIDWNANETTHGLFGAELTEKKKQLLQRISVQQKESFNSESDKHKLAHDIRNLKIDLLINQLELMIKLANQDQEPKATSFKDKKKFVQAQQTHGRVLGWKSQIKRLQGIKQKKVEHLDFFDWKLDFPEVMNDQLVDKPGFDIVIGNPPYVSHDRVSHKEYFKLKYKVYEPFTDLYAYFFEKGIQQLRTNGQMIYITSNSFLKAEYGKPLRKYIRNEGVISCILNLEDAQIFQDAIVNTCILGFIKNKEDKKAFVVNSVYNQDYGFVRFISDFGFYYSQDDFDDGSWGLITPLKLGIFNKLKQAGSTLEKLGTQINLGIATGANEVFVLSKERYESLIGANSKNADILKPILRGRDIQRYYYELPDLRLILSKNGIDVKKDFPEVYSYLDGQDEKFKNRGAQGQHWTNLRACSFFEDFKKEKIVWIELSDINRFALCTEEIYLLNSAYFLIPPKEFLSEYLLSILNSKVIYFYHSIISNTSGMGTARWINVYVKEFPIP